MTGYRVEPTEAGTFHLVTPGGARVTYATRAGADNALTLVRAAEEKRRTAYKAYVRAKQKPAFECLADLHSRCVALAHEKAFNPYCTADAEFWLHHAERLDSIVDGMIDDELAADAA